MSGPLERLPGIRNRDIFPAGFDKKIYKYTSLNWGGTHLHKPEYLYHYLVDTYIPEIPIESITVKSAWYGKGRKGHQHEFIVFQVEDIDVEGLINYLVLDRNPDGSRPARKAYVPAMLQLTKADDAFRISHDGDIKKLLEECQLTPYKFLEELKFNTDTPLRLYEVVTLADVVSNRYPFYHRLDSSCYLFSGAIWECLRLMRPSAAYNDALAYRRGKANWFRYIVNTIAVQEVHQEVQVRLLEAEIVLRQNRALARLIARVAQDAQYDTCTESQRYQDITEVSTPRKLHDWAESNCSPAICLVSGMASSGKSVIAYDLCKRLGQQQRLGASFFCSRASPSCHEIGRIIPTIAYQLWEHIESYKDALVEALDHDPDIITKSVKLQFEGLVAGPLSKSKNASPSDFIVVIDGLDKCEDSDGISQLVDALLQFASGLRVRFVVTSRPGAGIIERVSPEKHLKSIVHLCSIDEDVNTFLRLALSMINPSNETIKTLTTRADGSLIFATTLVRYISVPRDQGGTHTSRLQDVLTIPDTGGEAHKNLDALYSMILSKPPKEQQSPWSWMFVRQLILWTVVSGNGKIAVGEISEQLGTGDEKELEMELQRLQSVLDVNHNTGSIATFHDSFVSFLLSEERSGKFWCWFKTLGENETMASHCFNVMKASLRFNICGFESSQQFDKNVADLQNKAHAAISGKLLYACRYWSKYLSKEPPSAGLLVALEEFLRCRLLFWMEVLNLKAWTGDGVRILSEVSEWLPDSSGLEEMHQLVGDARRFVIAFSTSPVSLSTPHIYLSLLPFTTKTSHVWTSHWPQTRGLLSIEGTAVGEREAPIVTYSIGSAIHTVARSSDGKCIFAGSSDGAVRVVDLSTGALVSRLKNTDNSIWSVAVSPGGSRIASGKMNGDVCFWDLKRGTFTAGPCLSHAKLVFAMGFSHDGTRLASSAEDCTIRIWDAGTGAQIGMPIECHRSRVTSIVFFPNGQLLASGSDDSTIKIWDLQHRAMIGDPWVGHGGRIHSVTLSPNGLCLASGSHDRTVRVWDVRKGTMRFEPLRGHKCDVSSVAFSPDSSTLASGSWDHTICVWDALHGTMISRLTGGHTGWVNSVCFSADGTQIFSGSDDGTIRAWDTAHAASSNSNSNSRAHLSAIRSISFSPDCRQAALGSTDSVIYVQDAYDGTPIAGPLHGHTEEVTSVAFSPGGLRLVSGSTDRTCCIWDIATNSLPTKSFRGHAGWVRCAIFSPDGVRVASCSDDWTIRIWSADTGEQTIDTLRGHTDTVMSIAFSPDGTHIVSGSTDRTLRMWRAIDGALLCDRSSLTDVS